MMRTYLRRAYRLRRIAALVGCGLLLQGLANYITWGHHPGYDLAYVVGYMDFYVGLAASALLGALIFPSFACSVVVVVFSLSIAAPVFLSNPGFFRSLPMPVTFGLCLLLFYGVFYLLFRPFLDRVLPNRPATFHTAASTKLSKETAWDGFFSLPPDTSKRYNAEDIVAFDKEPGGDTTYRIRERVWNLAQIESLMTINDRSRPDFASHDLVILDLPETHELRQMQVDYKLTDTSSDGTSILVSRVLPRTTLRSRFVFWILDHFGTATDMMLNKLEKTQS